MSIRIETVSDANGMVVKVDGWLRQEDVEELAKVVQSAQGATVLDLSDLQSADRSGVDLLKELIALGTRVRGVSPYLDLLLKTKPQ